MMNSFDFKLQGLVCGRSPRSLELDMGLFVYVFGTWRVQLEGELGEDLRQQRQTHR